MGNTLALSYLEVHAAKSTNHPEYEYFAPDQLTSVNDHDGNQMYVVTAELGNGSSQYANMMMVIIYQALIVCI